MRAPLIGSVEGEIRLRSMLSTSEPKGSIYRNRGANSLSFCLLSGEHYTRRYFERGLSIKAKGSF